MEMATQPHCAPTAPLSQLLKAAGDELRLTILQALATDSYGVLELSEAFAVKQSGMSHHLKVLSRAGLVVTRREGNSIFYRRATTAPDDPLAETKSSLFRQLDALPLDGSIAAGLRGIWQARAEASRQFFLENASKFKAQQDLIARYDVYGQQMAELLRLTKPAQHRRALEVGPGEGEFLTELSKQFARVTALDNSRQMLDKAKARALDEGLHNVDFVLGDTGELAGSADAFDCAVINMVLHHTPSPVQIFADVSHSLAPGGALLVTELCPHDQSWTQEACGDIWLGFEPDDLNYWAAETGLTEGQSVYFALRNGFQIQLREFIKPPHHSGEA